MKLVEQLAKMERRWKWVHFIQAGGRTALLAIAVLLAGSATDYLLPLTFSQRLLLTVICHSTILSYGYFYWIRPFRRPMKLEQVAWLLEDAVPEFQEKLISAVELTHEADDHISLALIEHVLSDASVDLDSLTPGKLFPVAPKHFVVPLVLSLLFIVMLSIPTLKMGRLLKRVVIPSVNDATVGKYDLLVMEPKTSRVAEGDTINIVVKCTDTTIRNLELCVEDKRVRRYIMKYDEDTKLFRYTIPECKRSFKYWAQSENILSRAYDLTVLQRPRIDEFTITYSFPEYMGLPSSSTKSTSGNLKAYAGTVVEIKIKASKPLSEMSITWLDEKANKMSLSRDASEASASFTMLKSGAYKLSLLDQDDLQNRDALEYNVVVLDDKPPTVSLEKPKTDLHRGINDSIDFKWISTDDFGITDQKLVCMINGSKKVFDLDVKVEKYRLPVSSLSVKSGDEVEMWIEVTDAAKQSSESQHRMLYLSTAGELKGVGEFLESARRLSKRLDAGAGRVEIVRDLFEKVSYASEYATGANAENLSHNLLMISRHCDKIIDELEKALSDTDQMKANSFFSRSQVASDLMGKYFTQERIFTVPEIKREEQDVTALASLTEMLDLADQMTEALIKKAGEKVTWVNSKQIKKSAQALPGLKKNAAASLRKQISERVKTASDAAGLNIPISKEGKQGSETSGLEGRYYKGKNNYVLPGDPAEKKPHKIRFDPVIEFAHLGAFKYEREKFSIIWKGFVKTDIKGQHAFFISSDDGSRLFIGGKEIINNDGYHAAIEKKANIQLQPGSHPIMIIYHNSGGSAQLSLSWQQPGKAKEIVPASALSSRRGDAFALMVTAFELQAGSRAREYRTIDQLIRQIRSKLKSTSSKLKEAARDIELYERDEDWEKIEELADELQNKEDKTGDLDKVAEALEDAASTKDIDDLVKIAGLLDDVEDYNELLALKEEIDELQAEAEEAIPEAKKDLAADKKEEAIDELTQAERAVDFLKEASVDGKAIKDNSVTRPVYNELKKAEAALDKAKADIEAAPKEVAEKSLSHVNDKIDDVVEKMDKALDSLETKHDQAIKNLDVARTSDQENISQIEEALMLLPDTLSNVDLDTPDTVEQAEEQVEELAESMKEAISDLLDSAEEAMLDSEGDIDKARADLAMAETLEKINEEKLKPAQEAFQNAIVEKKKPDTLFEKLASASAERKREKNLEKAKEEYKSALEDIQKAKDMVEKAEALAERELSQIEEQAVRDELEKLAEETLDKKTLDSLDAIEKLHQSERDAGRLKDDVDNLKKRPNANNAKKMSKDAEEISKDLDKVFDVEDKPEESEKKPDLNLHQLMAMTEQLDALSRDIAQVKAAEAAAEEIKDDLLVNDRKALEMLDQIPLDEMEKIKDKVEHAIATIESEDANRIRKKDELFRLADSLKTELPDLKNEMKKLAKELEKENKDENVMRELNNTAKRDKASAERTAQALERALVKEDDQLSTATKEKAQKLAENIAKDDLESAEKNLDALKKDLEELVERSAEPMPQTKEELIADGITDLKQSMHAMPQSEKKELKKAVEAAEKGDLKKAKELAEKAAEPRSDEAEIAKHLREAEALQNENKSLMQQALAKARENKLNEAAIAAERMDMDESVAEALNDAAEELKEAGEKALEDAYKSDDANRRNRLKDAATHAMNDNVDHAINLARQAGKDGKEAVKAFQEAKKASDAAKKMLEEASKTLDDNNQPAKEALKDLNKKIGELKADPKKKDALAKLERAKQHLERDEFRTAADNAQSAAEGAYEAEQAAEKFAEAAQMDAIEPEFETSSKADVPPEAKAKVNQARAEMDRAEADLNTGKAQSKTAERVETAEQAISDAAETLAKEIMQAHQPDDSDDSDSQDGDPSPDSKGKLTDDAEQEREDAELGKSWDGVDGTLDSKDKKHDKQKYNDYYRNANMRYLERIQKEK